MSKNNFKKGFKMIPRGSWYHFGLLDSVDARVQVNAACPSSNMPRNGKNSTHSLHCN